jgi:hypothetical protein
MTSSRIPNSRQTRQGQLNKPIAEVARQLVELVGKRINLADVHYLAIEREWIDVVYVDDSRVPLLQYRQKP